MCSSDLFATLLFNVPAEAGGPLLVGAGSAGFGQDMVPFTWDMSGVASPLVSGGQIQYRTDGGFLGVRDNATATTSVNAMFQLWENVGTSNVAFNNAGGLQSTGAFSDGDVSTAAEFNAVEGSCGSGTQNPIVYDANGTLFSELGEPSGVIGFAGACAITIVTTSPGRIVSAQAALNGNFRDCPPTTCTMSPSQDPDGLELTDNEFDAVFIHEFGHFFGLDHSQINQNCLASQGGCADFSDDSFGLPTMFPFLIGGLEETAGVHPARTLSTDDIAWVSRLYPDGSFASSFGTISGNIFYSTHNAPGLGFNVIARQVDNPGTPGINESRRIAVSSVSGYLGTACPGHPLGGNCGQTSSFGSRNPSLVGLYDALGLPPGSYTVEVEGINSAFTGGSRVGPVGAVGFQWPLPGPPEFFNNGESNSDNPADSSPVVVSAGGTVSNINIIMNGTLPGQDALEPNTSTANAAPIPNGTTANFSISPFGNEDFYTFTVNANTTATFEVFADRLIPSSPLDSVMEIVNASGTRQNLCRPLGSGGSFNQSCLNDDLNFPAIVDSGLEFRSPSGGTFFVHLVDFLGDGRPELQY